MNQLQEQLASTKSGFGLRKADVANLLSGYFQNLDSVLTKRPKKP